MNLPIYTVLALLAVLPHCRKAAPTTAPPAPPRVAANQPDEVLLADGRPATHLAFPAIFEAAFRPGTTVRQDSLLLHCRPLALGRLRSETGKLVAGDPLTLGGRPAFTQRFPLGEFAVQLALVRYAQSERVGFVQVVFDTARVARWQLALLPGQPPLALRDSSFYCYGVDGGIAAILDSAANRQLAQLAPTIQNQAFFDAAAQPGYAGYLYRFGGHNLATFATGLGDGCYPTYLGFSTTGQVCRLLTDFRMVNW